jgi:hypothetical protein
MVAAALVASLLLSSAGRADENKTMAIAGGVVIAASVVLAGLCAWSSIARLGDSLGEHYSVGSSLDGTIIGTCSAHAALMAVGVPLTAVGVARTKRAERQLRVGLTGVFATF